MTAFFGRGLFVAGLCLLGSGYALAHCPSTTGRFALEGPQVRDTHTGLVWARCSVGQHWDGSACAGRAHEMTYAQALEYARRQPGWDLPDVQALASLVDRACAFPAIDSAAFPNTVSGRFWSATASAGRVNSAWGVGFDHGDVHIYFENFLFAVRLMRTEQMGP